MRFTVHALFKNALILAMTILSICQESMGTVLSSLPKTVIPIFCTENVSPIAETTPMHLPLSATFGLAGGGETSARVFGWAGCCATAALPTARMVSKAIGAQRTAEPTTSAATRDGMVSFQKGPSR